MTANPKRGFNPSYDEDANAAGLVMLPRAAQEAPGVSYAGWKAAGWTDALLIEKGYARRFLHPLERHARRAGYYQWFWKWLHKNGHILDVFLEHAFEARRMGFEKYGANGIIGVIRWHTREREIDALADFSEETAFKISNNVASQMARLAMDMYPQLDGLFNTHLHGNGYHAKSYDGDLS